MGTCHSVFSQTSKWYVAQVGALSRPRELRKPMYSVTLLLSVCLLYYILYDLIAPPHNFELHAIRELFDYVDRRKQMR